MTKWEKAVCVLATLPPIVMFIGMFAFGCATPRSSGGRAEIGGNAQVESVDTSSTQTERGTSVQDAQITGDVVTSNADLGKGWGGLLGVCVVLFFGAIVLGIGLPAPPAPWGFRITAAGVLIILFAFAILWRIYT